MTGPMLPTASVVQVRCALRCAPPFLPAAPPHTSDVPCARGRCAYISALARSAHPSRVLHPLLLAVNMASIRSVLASAPLVGVSGSRRPTAPSLAALQSIAPLVAGAVVTGCASGIDARARLLWPSACVISAASFGGGRGAFARRSATVVQRVAAARGVWLSFPLSSRPAGLVPSASMSACFSGRGSGSWASLALALGLGCSALVYLPTGLTPASSFGLSPLGGGWFWRPAAPQVSLF